MQLELIIAALRQRCAGTFAQRIGGAAQFKLLPETTALPVPCAYVIPLDDSPEESRAQNAVRQTLVDSFAVVVAISNVPDEKGQGAAASVNSIRSVLWGALLGWRPTVDYNGIAYQGGQLLALDRARIWYQFEFGAEMEIGPEDGWEQTEQVGLPHFDGADIKIDPIDPHDNNLVQTPAPDGHIDVVVRIPKTGNLPE